jgi:hypothetical protein
LYLQAADGTTTLAQQLPKALQEAVQTSVFLDRAPEARHVIFEAQQQQQQQQLEQEQAVVQAQQQQLEQLQGENVEQ